MDRQDVKPPFAYYETRATNYRVEMLDDDAHRAFADALNNCRASVVLSGYDSPLYEELFDGWHSMRLAAPTTLSGDTVHGDGRMTTPGQDAQACPTCGDQNVHANIPSEIIACATRKALVDALHAYAEEIDERSHLSLIHISEPTRPY